MNYRILKPAGSPLAGVKFYQLKKKHMTKEEHLHAQSAEFLDGRLTHLEFAALAAMDEYARQKAIGFLEWFDYAGLGVSIGEDGMWYNNDGDPIYTTMQLFEKFQKQN